MTVSSDAVILSVASHPAFGRLIVMTAAAAGGRVRLTMREALILSRALAAVTTGASAETEIYLSPIADDGEVCGRATAAGVALRLGAADVALDRAAVAGLAAELARAAG